jgi:hypothetical protein
MGDFPALTACLPCKILYKAEQVRGKHCPKCGAKLQKAPDKILRAKKRVREKRQRERAVEQRGQDIAATRRDDSLPNKAKTARPAVSPITEQRRQKESNGDGNTLPRVQKPVSADDLLSALESAPIPNGEQTAPKGKKKRRSTRPLPGTKQDGSLFIPLDSFVEGAKRPLLAPIPVDVAGALFGASGQVGDSGITAQTEKARRGQVGELNEVVAFGDYELNEVLGRGGMGVVYRASQRSLGRQVALKLMSSQNIGEEDRLRFQREARAAARLRHPHIVPIFDIGTHNGHDYFTLELIEGDTLHKLAMAREIDVPKSLDVVRKVALAIDYAHSQGVIHRDLKPQNILIDLEGEPHVTDFGLAKDLQDSVNLTTAGIALGSPPYMPPEQAMGNYDKVDAVSDVYGLGAILYECLAARPPFIGQTPYEIIARVQSEDPIEPRQFSPEVPVDAEVICLKAMDKVKNQRYQSALEMAEDLERAIGGEAILARPPTFTVKLARRLVKYRFQVASLAISLAVVLAMAIFAWSVYVRGERKRAPAPVDYQTIPTDQLGSPIDQALEAAREGRFQLGLERLSGALNGQPVDRDAWLSKAQAQVLGHGSKELQQLLFKALDKSRSRSAGETLTSKFLLEALSSGMGEIPEAIADEYITASKKLISLYMDSAFPIQTPIANRDSPLEERLASLPQILESSQVLARRGDGELAHSLSGVFLQVIRAGFNRQQGRVESSRTLMIRVLADEAPARAILPFSQALLRLEGGMDQLGGRLFLEQFTRTFRDHPHRGLIKSLREDLPIAKIDPSSGHVRAQSKNFRSLRWRFPECALANKSNPKAYLGTQALLERANSAAFPSNPIQSIDGSRIYIGWLTFVYTVDNKSGRILSRSRVPARVHGLRSFKDGFLVVTVIRSSGRAINRPKYEELLLDPGSGRLRRLTPGYESSGPRLPKSHNIAFEPLLRNALKCEADAWLQWSLILEKEQQIRDEDVRLASQGKTFEERKRALKGVKAALLKSARSCLTRSNKCFSRDPTQPWMLLRRATLNKHLGDPNQARKIANSLASSILEKEIDYLTPFEDVQIAIELEELGFQRDVGRLLRGAFTRLLRDYHYVPSFAGFGDNDPGQVLTALLDKLLVRGSRAPAKKRRALLERYRLIEGWRDAFAPALASSSAARRARLLVFGKSSPVPKNSPKPIPLSSHERQSAGFAGLGLGTILVLDMLLFGTTKYLLFFGTFVVVLTCLGVYRRQKRDLVLLGFLTWRESVEAWYRKPMLRLQHSFASYWTIRDRLGLCLVILLFLVALALHDTIVTALDAREQAPRPLFVGLPGHPQVLEYLQERDKKRATAHTRSLLAFALAKSEEQELAIAYYSDLVQQVNTDPYAFNACLLRDYGKLQGPRQRSALASKLDSLIDDESPERHWARYALTKDKKALERALELAQQRFTLIDEFANLRPVLVAPGRSDRDEVVLGRGYWWSSFTEHLFGMFLSSQDGDQLAAACKRVLGGNPAGTHVLVEFRTRAFFLLPAALLVILASLLLPSRNRESFPIGGWGFRKIDFLFPGVPQFLRGYAPSGVLLGSLLIFLVRYIFEGRIVKVFPFARLANLAGEAGSSEGAVFFQVRILLLGALLLLFAIHALHMKRLLRSNGGEGMAKEGTPETKREAALVDS